MSRVLVDTRQPQASLARGVVAVAVLDGFYGCGSGAGWSNRALIEILAKVLPIEIDLIVLPVRIDAISGPWQQDWRRAVEQVLDRSVRRVEVRALDGDWGGPGRRGEPALTDAVEREVARLRGEYRRGLVVLCDVGFSGAAARSTANSAWTTVIVPRTSALLVQPELPDWRWWTADSPDRLSEATRRIRRGLDLLQNPDTVRSMLARSLQVADRGTVNLVAHTPPLVRFLTELSRARCAQVTVFGCGAAARLPFLPRLRYGRTVVAWGRHDRMLHDDFLRKVGPGGSFRGSQAGPVERGKGAPPIACVGDSERA